MKPALMRGDILAISTATPAEYLNTVAAAPWLEQLFTVIEVRPPSEAEAVTVLRGLKERFERFHGVTYTDEALRYAVFHSNSYFPNRHLPEKAVDLIDEAGARVKLQIEVSDEVAEVKKRIELIVQRQDRAIVNHEFEEARFCADQLRKERDNLRDLKEKTKIDEPPTAITRAHIEQIVAERTGVSLEKLRTSCASEAASDPEAQ
jgi:ATP-dependent Clp protease ATP-binding subunit ClpC